MNTTPWKLIDAAADVLGRIDPLALESESDMIAWAHAVAAVADSKWRQQQ